MYYLSLIIAAFSGMLYHLCQKSIDSKADPIISILITYAVAFGLSLLLYLFQRDRAPLTLSIGNLNWASYLLGISIVGIELGMLLAYRAGWDLGRLSLVHTLILALILIPAGMVLFRETHTLRTYIGIGISIAGLLIMKL